MNLDIAYITSTQPRTVLDIFEELPVDMILSLVGRGCLEPIILTVEDFDNRRINLSMNHHWVGMRALTLVALTQEVFEVLLRTCFPFWRDYPPRRKHWWILNRLSSFKMTADSLRRLVIFPYGPVRPIDAQVWMDDGASLLSLVFSYYLRFSSNPDTGDWDTLLEEAIKASDDIHHILDSPFIYYRFRHSFSAFKSALVWSLFDFRDWKEDKTTTRHELRELTVNLQHMMSILANCGHDLLEFGRQEAATWARKRKSDKIVGDTLYIGIKYDWVRYIRTIHYGAEPRDWYFELDYHYEDCAGAFWNLIENPHLYMLPGAWIDEE